MATPATLALIRFREPDINVLPSDDVGSLADLNVDTGLSLPPVVSSFTGFGRQFSNGFAVDGQDVVPGATLATRDVTVRAIVSWDFAGQNSYGSPGAIVTRGKGNAAAEYVSYGLELRVVNAALNIGELRMWWQDSAGVIQTARGGQFVVPASGSFMMVTAVRNWISSSQVSLRYYVGDQLIADQLVSSGDIGGGTTGTFCVGTRYTAGTPGRFLAGVIDEIQVLNYEVTAEETAATWDRMSRLQPRGYRAVRDLLPPGLPISDDPGSRIQKLLRLVGHGIGYAAAQTENARRNLLPDRAFGPALEQWEGIVGESPAPSDTTPTRRRRVVAHLSQRAGSSIPGVNATLADMLALNQSQVQYLAFDNTIREDWSSGLRAERWRADPAAQWSVVGGALQASVTAGPDIRFDGANRSWSTCLTAVDATPAWLPGSPSCNAFMKITPTTLDAGSEVGMVFYDFARVNAFLFGIRSSGALVIERFLRGASQGLSVLASLGGLIPVWIQLRQDTSSLIQDATGESLQPHTVRWSTTSATSGFTQVTGIQFSYCVNWVGMYARSTLASTGNITATFDDIAIRSRRGARPFNWYVYRDPALPGSPDLLGARRALKRLAQAHTRANVITSKSCIWDDATAGFDLGPAGGL